MRKVGKRAGKSIKKAAGRPDEFANIDFYRASSESVHADLGRRRLLEVPTRELQSTWRAYVRQIRRLTATWPRILADRVADITDPEEKRLLSWADQPRLPVTRRQFLTPGEVKKILAGPRAKWPWPQEAEKGIARFIGAGLGIEVCENGWLEWDPSSGIPAVPYDPPPMLWPLFEKLYEAMRNSPTTHDLAKALTPKEPAPLPPKPKTTAEARLQYRRAASRLKRYIVRSKRGEFQDAKEALSSVEEAARSFQRCWINLWSAGLERVAGDRAKALASARGLRLESLGRLEAVFTPAKPKRKSAPRRKPAKKTASTKKKKVRVKRKTKGANHAKRKK